MAALLGATRGNQRATTLRLYLKHSRTSLLYTVNTWEGEGWSRVFVFKFSSTVSSWPLRLHRFLRFCWQPLQMYAVLLKSTSKGKLRSSLSSLLLTIRRHKTQILSCKFIYKYVELLQHAGRDLTLGDSRATLRKQTYVRRERLAQNILTNEKTRKWREALSNHKRLPKFK